MQIKFKIFSYLQVQEEHLPLSPQDHLEAPKHLDDCISPSVLADGTNYKLKDGFCHFKVTFICIIVHVVKPHQELQIPNGAQAAQYSFNTDEHAVNMHPHTFHARQPAESATAPFWSHTQESGEPVNLFALFEGLRVVE